MEFGRKGGSSDPPRDYYNKLEDSDYELESSELNEPGANDYDLDDKNDVRNHIYKILHRNLPNRSTYVTPIQIDHTIPMAVWKKLLDEINNGTLTPHLIRARNNFLTILGNIDINSITQSNIQKYMREFPAMEISQLIHSQQSTTYNSAIQKDACSTITNFILRGKWDEAIIFVFKDQHEIARKNNTSGPDLRYIRRRQRSFVRNMRNRGILTEQEALNVFKFIKKSKNM